MRTTAGRRVKGTLVQGADGLWREGSTWNAEAAALLSTADVVDAFERGASRGEIAAAIAKAHGVTTRPERATIYKHVSDLLRAAGIHGKPDGRRVRRGLGTGEAALPLVLA